MNEEYIEIKKFENIQDFPEEDVGDLSMDIENSDDRLVGGWATVEIKDNQGDVVPISLIKKAMLKYMGEYPTIILQHMNKPVGKAVYWTIKKHAETGKNGVYIVAKIYKDKKISDFAWDNIKKKLIRGFSIGGIGKGIEKRWNGEDARVLTEFDIDEISVVDAPANKYGDIEKMSYAKSDSSFESVAVVRDEEYADIICKALNCEKSHKDGLFYLYKSDKEVEEAMKHPDKLGAGAEKRTKLNPKDKVKTVMREYERGTLRSGSGEKVTDRDQAIAIAMSEAGLSKSDDEIQGGKADNKSVESIAQKHKVDSSEIEQQLQEGIKVEMEHTNDEKIAREIAMDHLEESPVYYTKLKEMESSFEKGLDVGYMMAEYDVPDWDEIQKFIKEEDLHEKGRELNPHVTIGYGFNKQQCKKEIFQKMDNYSELPIRVDDLAVFEKEDYDVLVMLIDSPTLKEVNKNYENDVGEQEYDYNPHMTIAYMKKGKGNEFLESMNGYTLLGKMYGKKFNTDKVSYGVNDGELEYHNLNKPCKHNAEEVKIEDIQKRMKNIKMKQELSYKYEEILKKMK